jgi:hypothetical protein
MNFWEVKMSKRYYYNSPIKALYMMKEFGVKYDFENEENLIRIIKTPEIRRDNFMRKIYVAKESEHIFEPKKRDEGRWARPVGAHYANHNGEQWVSAGIEPNPPEIIMRDNKQFFMPEVEND